MIAAWGLPIAGTAIGQLVTAGRITDVGVMMLWVGLFALGAWVLVVLPLMIRCSKRKIFSDLRFSWLGWSVLAIVLYSVMVVLPLGIELLAIIWYPALMGGIAGVVFALLLRRGDEAIV